MTQKLTSAITKITLNDATFHNKVFAPTYINFLFGNNGCGKSTISRSIKAKVGLDWETGRTAEDFNLLVYNEDFIKRNIASYGGMPGVFTISEQNAEVQQKIDETTSLLGDAQKDFTKASAELGTQEVLVSKQYDTFQNICWEKTKDFRKAVDAALTGKKTKDGFAKALLSEKTPQLFEEIKLISTCEAAFSTDATTYPELFIGDSSTLPSSMLLDKKIISSGDSAFSTFMKAMNSANWVRQGHEAYHASANGKCPYCQRELPEDFEIELARCFDAEYEADLIALRQFKTIYSQAANALLSGYSANLKNAYPKISEQLKDFSTVYDAFSAKIQLNIQRIDEKLNSPDVVVLLEDVAGLIAQLNQLAEGMNSLIRENNTIVNDRTKKQPQCKKDVISHLAAALENDIQSYRESRSTLQKEIDRLTTEKHNADANVKKYRSTLLTLRKQVVNTAAAVEGINALLKDTGFNGFHIREKKDAPNVYEVIRTETGFVAENLSEGERNFIAFLYFHQLVLGSDNAEAAVKDKIVVIDDPVSSMDSSTLFVVGALVRDMIAICNPDYTTKEGSKDFIKQLFILTHNAFFHQEVTYNQVQHYQYVSFFEVVKMDNQSDILPCFQNNREMPSLQENRNPVQNSYAALWDTYREVSSPNTLVNVIRQILDYYFLQLCGYSGVSIKDEILKKNRDKFVLPLPDGSEDTTEYHMAASLLQYLCTSNDRISDGLNFIHTSIDTESCRKIFEKIFRHMGQGQHYDMMMNRVI